MILVCWLYTCPHWSFNARNITYIHSSNLWLSPQMIMALSLNSQRHVRNICSRCVHVCGSHCSPLRYWAWTDNFDIISASVCTFMLWEQGLDDRLDGYTWQGRLKPWCFGNGPRWAYQMVTTVYYKQVEGLDTFNFGLALLVPLLIGVFHAVRS